MLCDYVQPESALKERIRCTQNGFLQVKRTFGLQKISAFILQVFPTYLIKLAYSDCEHNS